MTFQNITFPEIKLKHGVTKQVLDPVIITGNGTREVRRRQNRWERFVWNYPARNVTEADKQAIHTFLRGVNIQQDSFLFQDPTLPAVTDMPLSIDPRGTSAYRQFALTYGPEIINNVWSENNKHPLFNTDISGLVFKRDGVVVSTSVVGITNGYVSLYVPGANSGTLVTVSGPIKFVVRFSGDISWNISAMTVPNGGLCSDVAPSIVQLNDFQLIEVFE